MGDVYSSRTRTIVWIEGDLVLSIRGTIYRIGIGIGTLTDPSELVSSGSTD